MVGPFLKTHFPLFPQNAARDPWKLKPCGQLSRHFVLKFCWPVRQEVGKTLTWSSRETGGQEIFPHQPLPSSQLPFSRHFLLCRPNLV